VVQHATQQQQLPVRLRRHTTEHHGLALCAADLRDEDLEGTHPVAAHRPHVAGVDAQRDRALLRRRSRRLRWCQRRALEPGADPQGPLPRCFERRGVPQREEFAQQRQGAAVRQRGAHRGDDPLVLGRAAVGHDLRHRRDRAPAGDTAPAWTEAGSTNLHHPEQRSQPPPAQVLERALRPAPIAPAPAAAVLVDLHRDEVALHRGQDRLTLLQAEAQRRCGMPGWRALAGTDLVHLPPTVGPGHFQHHPPPHHIPGP
jgi:hypothetical protein